MPNERAAKYDTAEPNFGSPLASLVFLWLAAAAFLGFLALQDVPYDRLLLDRNYLSDLPWHAGLVSNLGILAWTIAASIGLFIGWLCKTSGRVAAAKMFTTGGTLSTILLLDDLFQLHTLLEPTFGVPNALAFLALAGLASTWAYTNRSEINRSRTELLIGAAAAFIVSIAFDQLSPAGSASTETRFLIAEDATKFLGVLAWAQFFVLSGRDVAQSILRTSKLDPEMAR